MTNKNKVIAQACIDYKEDVVSINYAAIGDIDLPKIKLLKNNEQYSDVANLSLKESCRYLIALNSINYQFWDVKENGEFIRYENDCYVGALAMNKGFENLYKFMCQNKFNTGMLNIELISNFFGDIPEKEERLSILKESFNPIFFEKVFEIIDSDSKKGFLTTETAEKIAAIMPISFSDPYLKKIQLAIYEIAAVYNARSNNVETDITVAADYQIPKVLEGLGVLKYSDNLSRKINNKELIEQGSIEEKALRAATILACDEIAYQHKLSIPVLDKQLWLLRNKFNSNFHLTKTPMY